ncbi:MAG: hypothetical protein ACJ75S_08660 [Solirubrobacterales bacterium]
MPMIAEELAAAAITDSLLRAESPLSAGGIWTKPSWDTSISSCTEAEGWKVTTVFATGEDGARLSDAPHLQTLVPGIYVYTLGTISLASKSTAGRWVGLWALMDKEAQTGYRARAEVEADTTKWKLYIERGVAGEYTVLAEKAGISLPNGIGELGRFGLVVGEGEVSLYYRLGKEGFGKLLGAGDKTLSAGFGGMAGKGNFMRLKEFAVGTFAAPPASGAVTPQFPLSRCCNPIVNP